MLTRSARSWFKYAAWASAIGISALVVTGGLVRVTGSGLGCPDWPTCTHQDFVAQLSYHPLVEFLNRVFSGALTVAVAAVLVGAYVLRRERSDFAWPSIWLGIGMIGQIILGGLVVHFKLFPPLVMAHFLITFAMIADAFFLAKRAGSSLPGKRLAITPKPLRVASKVQLTAATIVILVGTAVSGAGPLGGARGTKRLPISFRAIAELHSTLALFLVGICVGTVMTAWASAAPRSVMRSANRVVAGVAVQAVIGYSQYFLKVPPALVALHLAGATILWLCVLDFELCQYAFVAQDDGSSTGTQCVEGDQTGKRTEALAI